VFFHFFPFPDAQGDNQLDAERLLSGFGNSALIAVLALLVVGEGLVQTDALNTIGRMVVQFSDRYAWFAVIGILIFVAILSGFVNNTPLVIIFIPILQAVSRRLKLAASIVMIPLSYATILGGMTTLLGSSTNLLVSSSLLSLNQAPLGVFEVTPVGLVVATAGMLYIIFFARRLLPHRETLAQTLTDIGSKEFIVQLTVTGNSRLVGNKPTLSKLFQRLPDVKIKFLQRGEHAYTDSLDDVVIQSGDLLVVVATRQGLMELLARDPGLRPGKLPGDREEAARIPGNQLLVEVMVVPRSPVIGRSLEQINFRHRTRCIVLGLCRRSQLIHLRMTGMRLLAGDVLLIQGAEPDVQALRRHHEVVLLAGTFSDLHQTRHGRRALLIFAVMIALAAFGVMPIVLAAIFGATAMIVSGTLTLRQAGLAIDRRIVLLVGSALALGEAMEVTGAGAYLAQTLLGLLQDASPAVILMAFFAVVMAITNVLSNNACAVLFTPVAVNMAESLGLDPHIFAIAVLIASDGCFATPIGYQTNLLVMGPGQYTFADFLKFGLPLSLVVCLTFALFAPWWFGL
jgi:di/tricarboxylate transporter